MKKILIVIAIVAIAGAAGAWYALTRHSSAPESSSTTGNVTSPSPNSGSNIAQALPKVSIQNFAFSPASLRVQQGTVVTWTNSDSTAHTITETDGQAGPDSGTLNPGLTYSFKFDKVGTYRYHCAFHPEMTGTIVVFSSAIK